MKLTQSLMSHLLGTPKTDPIPTEAVTNDSSLTLNDEIHLAPSGPVHILTNAVVLERTRLGASGSGLNSTSAGRAAGEASSPLERPPKRSHRSGPAQPALSHPFRHANGELRAPTKAELEQHGTFTQVWNLKTYVRDADDAMPSTSAQIKLACHVARDHQHLVVSALPEIKLDSRLRSLGYVMGSLGVTVDASFRSLHAAHAKYTTKSRHSLKPNSRISTRSIDNNTSQCCVVLGRSFSRHKMRREFDLQEPLNVNFHQPKGMRADAFLDVSSLYIEVDVGLVHDDLSASVILPPMHLKVYFSWVNIAPDATAVQASSFEFLSWCGSGRRRPCSHCRNNVTWWNGNWYDPSIAHGCREYPWIGRRYDEEENQEATSPSPVSGGDKVYTSIPSSPLGCSNVVLTVPPVSQQ